MSMEPCKSIQFDEMVQNFDHFPQLPTTAMLLQYTLSYYKANSQNTQVQFLKLNKKKLLGIILRHVNYIRVWKKEVKSYT